MSSKTGTNVSRGFFTNCVSDSLGAHPDWRYGQAVFNTAHALLPNRVEALRGTLRDCFYRDDKANDFLDALFPDGDVTADISSKATEAR